MVFFTAETRRRGGCREIKLFAKSLMVVVKKKIIAC